MQVGIDTEGETGQRIAHAQEHQQQDWRHGRVLWWRREKQKNTRRSKNHLYFGSKVIVQL